jgi:hypothetical protein
MNIRNKLNKNKIKIAITPPNENKIKIATTPVPRAPGSWTPPSALGIEPDSSMDAAAAVVDAIAMAAGGSGWLGFPSYVVTSTVRSSAHLWTCLRTGQPAAIVHR